jgi:DNA mismatch endonuclease (patch repair protein)|tara:strand:- start:812 stop:1216 length:405 start_codon:yes stop_codon:yes gene_type:complete
MDNLTVEQRKKNMSNIRSQNTLPEKKVMCELRRRKIYFTKNVKSIEGKPDILFRRKKVAVFIDSDFWHCHPTRFIIPKTNTDYWSEKINNNKQRDRKVNKILKDKGWSVIRIWEYDINKNFDRSMNQIISAIKK